MTKHSDMPLDARHLANGDNLRPVGRERRATVGAAVTVLLSEEVRTHAQQIAWPKEWAPTRDRA